MKQYFKILRLDQSLTLIFSLIKTILLLTAVGYIQKIFDSMINKDFSSGIYNLKILAVITTVYFVFIFIGQYLLRKLFFLGNFTFMKFLYSQILKKDYSDMKDESSGQVLSKITNDSKRISDWYSQGVVLMVMQALVFIVTVTYMLVYNIYVTFAMLVLTFLCFLVVQNVSKKMSDVVKEDQALVARSNQYILESLNSLLDVKQLRKESYFIKGFNSLIEERIDKNKAVAKYFSLYVGTSTIIAFVLPIISIIISSYFIINDQMTVGSAVALYTYSRMLDEPVRSISIQIGIYETSKKMEENFVDLVSYKTKEKEKLEAFEKLSLDINYFKHNEGSVKILENLKIEVNRGDFVLLKGASGVGKSSLVDIIMNNVKTSDETFAGKLRWNDSELVLKDTYSRILKTSQSPLIFEKSLRENILLGDDNLERRLTEVLYVVGLTELVEEKGLNYELTKNGDNLSGGQKQRLSLARILIRRPEFLVLDEPTSALNDSLSKEIAQNISDYCTRYQMTTLVVSHSSDFDEFATKEIHL
ncbi:MULTISPECIES: ABC transporter ATP-binding protein [unclassified Gemella]|uniref:ABC transporter transmembrane domain-containing protein n=1 Tax=unclassified Gemella TaxID=2624949 RepID=UPI001C045A1B|nr:MULTISPECIES: ABC transporter ATP-binding protein [unclassified Gemella]MBU0279071.1 ABC transporter ATP-binding protein/permease [Gemella sp. zg-1178]QWQ39123.1 ABC transporter ATP-binding protein/permease [Gemella sp. zg-570]